MKTENHIKTDRGMPLRITILALCAALLLPGIAMAKKPVESAAGCVIFPSDIYTGYAFTVKIVRDPAYTGVWSQPTADVAAVFTMMDGGTITVSSTQTISTYGVTYVNLGDTVETRLLAPSCNGEPCQVDTSVDAVITATVKEPINKGKRVRETVCTPETAIVNPSM